MAARRTNKKRLQRAEKHAANKRYAEAIGVYEEIAADSPDDVRPRMRIAELQRAAGQFDAAVTAYVVVADHCAARGFVERGIAAMRQARSIAIKPGVGPASRRPEIDMRLATLYAKVGWTGDAVAALRAAAAELRSNGQVSEALDALEQIANLEPSNHVVEADQAELCVQVGDHGSAAAHYAAAAHIMRPTAPDGAVEALEHAVQLARLSGNESDAEKYDETLHTWRGKVAPARRFLPSRSSAPAFPLTPDVVEQQDASAASPEIVELPSDVLEPLDSEAFRAPESDAIYLLETAPCAASTASWRPEFTDEVVAEAAESVAAPAGGPIEATYELACACLTNNQPKAALAHLQELAALGPFRGPHGSVNALMLRARIDIVKEELADDLERLRQNVPLG